MKVKIYTLAFLLFITFSNTEAQYISKNDSIITEAIAMINQDSVETQLQWLQDMGTRFMMAENHKEVSEAIKARFESFGMTEVRLDSFECYTHITYANLNYDTTTWQYNVEAKIIGSVYPDEEILLMGHHDNVQLDSDPELFAPGADDNASGTVAALETARVLMQMGYQPEKTIVFLTTAAEELMNFGDAGSEHYAAEAAASGRNIWGVINNDMIAYDNNTDVIGFSNVIGSEEITEIAALITYTYTYLTPNIPAPQTSGGADLKAFIEAGYTGVYLMEEVFNPFYHTEMDLVEKCDLEYLTEAIKISCGSVIYSDISVGTEELEVTEISMSLYPNPCHDHIKLNLHNATDDYDIFLMNTTGQVLHTQKVSKQEKSTSIRMADYPAGIYILQIASNGQLASAKIMKGR